MNREQDWQILQKVESKMTGLTATIYKCKWGTGYRVVVDKDYPTMAERLDMMAICAPITAADQGVSTELQMAASNLYGEVQNG